MFFFLEDVLVKLQLHTLPKITRIWTREIDLGLNGLTGNNELFTQSLISCPGYFGNILYCGDMRWSPEMLEDPVLQNVVSHRELDILYLDNTYSAPYCQFPSREEVKKQIFQIIEYVR